MLRSLVKRGFVTVAQAPPNDESHSAQEMIAKALILGTFVAYIFASVLSIRLQISYVYGQVIATLAIVEDPTVTAYITVDSGSDDPDAPLSEFNKDGNDRKIAEPELHLVRNRPITSSFRVTLRHLRARDGWTGPLRGAALRVVYCFLVAAAAGLMSYFPRPVGGIIALVLFSRLDLAWNNIVISEGSSQYWFRRLPALRTWFKVLPAASLSAVADHLAVLLPTQLARMNGLKDLVDKVGRAPPADDAERRAIVHALCRYGLAVVVVGLAVFILIQIPATVTLARVQASLLPDSEESIVPFDRSFGGKVVPEIIGGSGVVGMLDAWRSFGWSSRVRLLKLYAKVWAIQISLLVLFAVIFSAEVAYFMPEIANTLRSMVTATPVTVPAV
ncbi:hypothetical protein FGG08_004072 [Glutinoglossum americanum]|uniref:Uncharacterized protein n=1 Tax=Glutinoglossum americanum TaxID=1670608 RepID=A0A9P8L2V5_9PEZI|nr:hypothetical protein FGG08_004072 [Glutinoglossum americanum]